jgi:4-hydroxybenzoate polyprenyltransferase
MDRVLAFLSLTRPLNAFICGISVIAGAAVAGRPLDILIEPPLGWMHRTIAAAVSAALILAAGNVFNDIRDIAADRINAPRRALARGIVPPRAASVFAAVLALAGLAASLPLGTAGVGIAAAAVLLLAAYDCSLKGVPIAGNLAVAILGGLAVVFGGLAGHALPRALVPAGFAVLLHLGREIVKDADDERGDRAAGIATLATTAGLRVARRTAAGVLVLLVLAVYLPVAAGYFGAGYASIASAGVVLPVIGATWLTRFGKAERDLVRASMLLKLVMPFGIVAVFAGFQGY